MNILYAVTALLLIVSGVSATESENFHCTTGTGSNYPLAVCFTTTCAEKMKHHIKEEMSAAFAYMYLAARFDQDTVNRPGMAKFLYESANEERSHAILMLDYLNKRGIRFDQEFDFDINTVLLVNNQISNLTYEGALETALNMEIDVTNKIYQVIEDCSLDFHAADVFTNPILEEQHDGMRKLQGALKTFQDLVHGHVDSTDEIALAEYLFDLKMLSGVF